MKGWGKVCSGKGEGCHRLTMRLGVRPWATRLEKVQVLRLCPRMKGGRDERRSANVTVKGRRREVVKRVMLRRPHAQMRGRGQRE